MAKSITPARPLVGIAVEGVTTYGRSILRGVVRYANLQRKWVLHKDIWRTSGSTLPWPDCDGVIVAGVPSDVLDDVMKHSRHAVSCSGSYDPDIIPTIALDDEATASLAARHLLDCGLRCFACYSPPVSPWLKHEKRVKPASVRRAIAFKSVLAQQGKTCIYSDVPMPSYRDLLTHSHHQQLIRWLNELPKPVGIFAVDDMLAHDLAEACREADIGIPERVAIIGVNNDDLLCESVWPPLTSIEADFSRMGYLAAKMLDKLLTGNELNTEERHIRLPPIRVHQRMSTDTLATEQKDVAEALRYIREHACEPCTVDDVVKTVPVARRTLERMFVECLGRTPHDEIARVRADAACRMLLQLDLTIAEVAGRCGFSAIQSFNRFFLQKIGVTPAAYRRQSISMNKSAT